MIPFEENVSPRTDQLLDSRYTRQQVSVFMRREDLIHPAVSGNKWRKLKYAFLRNNRSIVVSKGGAYSNHILAVAVVAKFYGLRCHLLIRGEEHAVMNPTLSEVLAHDADIHFVPRGEYKDLNMECWIRKQGFPKSDVMLIPEGGSMPSALIGCAEIVTQDDGKFDFICCPQGTGGTAAGILCGINEHQRLLTFPVLKGDFFNSDINRLLDEAGKDSESLMARLEIDKEAHFGGYAKWNDVLVDFMREFHSRHSIALDPIYTAKMMYRLHQKILEGYFPSGTRILAIHTGGLQGVSGFNSRFGTDLPESDFG